MDLAQEINLVVDYHNREIALVGGDAMRREEGVLSQVEVFHNDSVVDVSHTIHIVETQLDRQSVHNE